jgi:hypothetical protein
LAPLTQIESSHRPDSLAILAMTSPIVASSGTRVASGLVRQ